MDSPAFDLAKASPAVTALLGTPPRFFDFGEAGRDAVAPYAVRQLIAGTPENYINQTPDGDSLVEQVDIYAGTMEEARAVRDALVAALEPAGHITSWNGKFKDVDTRLYRISFTVDFKTYR